MSYRTHRPYSYPQTLHDVSVDMYSYPQTFLNELGVLLVVHVPPQAVLTAHVYQLFLKFDKVFLLLWCHLLLHS